MVGNHFWTEAKVKHSVDEEEESEKGRLRGMIAVIPHVLI